MKTGDSAVKNVPAMHWGDAGSMPSQEDSLENQKTEYSTFSNYNFNIRKACETFIERGKSWLSVKPQKNSYNMGRRILYLEMRYNLKIQFILKTVNWTAIYYIIFEWPHI